MSGLTTHVIDAIRGGGAAGLRVTLSRRETGGLREVASASTDANGRATLLAPHEMRAGTYDLVFATAAFLEGAGTEPFFDDVVVRLNVSQAGEPHHVPLLLAPASYAVYRGGLPPTGDAALPPELTPDAAS